MSNLAFDTDNKNDPDKFLNKAKKLVVEYYNVGLFQSPRITADQVYIVWFSKTLQNWKALLSTDISDGRYYELTYNGDKQETYLDVYVKEYNVAILDQAE